jgi:hypothetical protein
MTDRLTTNMRVWQERSVKYPFHRETPHRGAPRPQVVERALGADVLRVPLPDLGVVFWGFRTKEAAERFSREFGATTYQVEGQ